MRDRAQSVDLVDGEDDARVKAANARLRLELTVPGGNVVDAVGDRQGSEARDLQRERTAVERKFHVEKACVRLVPSAGCLAGDRDVDGNDLICGRRLGVRIARHRYVDVDIPGNGGVEPRCRRRCTRCGNERQQCQYGHRQAGSRGRKPSLFHVVSPDGPASTSRSHNDRSDRCPTISVIVGQHGRP